jgi:hypothetical protein
MRVVGLKREISVEIEEGTISNQNDSKHENQRNK